MPASPVLEAIRRSALPDVNKWCSYGQHLAPLAESNRSSSTRDGRDHRCRPCDAARAATPEGRAARRSYNATEAGRERRNRYQASDTGRETIQRNKSERVADGRHAADARRARAALTARTDAEIAADCARLRPNGLKKCRHGEWRPLTDFWAGRGNPDGLAKICRVHAISTYRKHLIRYTATLSDLGIEHTGLCDLCEAEPATDADHIIPRSLPGSTDDVENIRWAGRCNQARSNDVTWLPEFAAWRDDEPGDIGSRPVRLGARKP